MSKIKLIDPKNLKSWLKKDEVILIDVREPFEFNESHIEKAINIPLSELLFNIDKLNGLKGKKLVMQCRAGIRSMTACKLLEKEGFEGNLWNLEGGLLTWKSEGFQVIEKKDTFK